MPQLRIIHIALCLGSAIITVVLAALRALVPAASGGAPSMVAWTLLSLSAMMILSAAALRTTIPPMDAAVDAAAAEAAWSARYRVKCVALWTVCEGGVVLSALAFFFGATPWMAGILAAGGLGYLASQSPGTLAGH